MYISIDQLEISLGELDHVHPFFGTSFLGFPSLLVRPNPELSPELQEQIKATIICLHLNDNQAIVEERGNWLKPYCQGKEDFSVLKRHAPFIAYELERQNLVEAIKNIMIYEPEE